MVPAAESPWDSADQIFNPGRSSRRSRDFIPTVLRLISDSSEGGIPGPRGFAFEAMIARRREEPPISEEIIGGVVFKCTLSRDARDIISAMTAVIRLQNKSLPADDTIAAGACRSPSSNSWLKSRTSPTSRPGRGPSAADMNVQLGSAGSPTLRLASVKVISYEYNKSVANRAGWLLYYARTTLSESELVRLASSLE